MYRHIASNSNDQWTSLPFLKKGENVFYFFSLSAVVKPLQSFTETLSQSAPAEAKKRCFWQNVKTSEKQLLSFKYSVLQPGSPDRSKKKNFSPCQPSKSLSQKLPLQLPGLKLENSPLFVFDNDFLSKSGAFSKQKHIYFVYTQFILHWWNEIWKNNIIWFNAERVWNSRSFNVSPFSWAFKLMARKNVCSETFCSAIVGYINFNGPPRVSLMSALPANMKFIDIQSRSRADALLSSDSR